MKHLCPYHVAAAFHLKFFLALAVRTDKRSIETSSVGCIYERWWCCPPEMHILKLSEHAQQLVKSILMLSIFQLKFIACELNIPGVIAFYVFL